MSDINEPVFKDTERFKVQQLLGSGGFGTVYQVYDQERNAIVALKTLRLTNAQSIYRFKQEFRALANVIHPNLVTLYELISTGDQWFFTMELVNGVSFLDYIQKINASSKFDTLREILKQLAEGLCALHKAGYLHCDIKSSNVLVSSEGRLVLLDFGLVTDQRLKPTNSNDEFVGSVDYMSPEQIINIGVSEASDWYSVGVMLYEALTGVLPFSGSFYEVITKKQFNKPLPPNELVNGLPEDLVNLCADLLSQSPQIRPTGQQIVSLLGGSKKTSSTISNYPNFLPTGREHHLEKLKKTFLALKTGKPVVASVQGNSGIGKSVLIRHFLENLQETEPNILIFSGRCYQQETVPYKAFDSLIDSLSRYLNSLDTIEANSLLPKDILALVRLFPVLQQVEVLVNAERNVLNIIDSQELRRRGFTALRELLINISQTHLVLLFIDDLQWGDIDSIALLGELLRPPDPPKMLLLLSYRAEEIKTSSLLKNFLPLLKTSYTNIEQEEITIDTLNSNESENLALALLEDPSPEACSLAKAIAQESGGNPFFISELVQYSKSTSTLNLKAQTFEMGSLKEKPSINTVVQIRILQLPENARNLLEMVAIAGQPIQLNLAKNAAKLEKDDPALLVMLRVTHLVRVRTVEKFEEIEPYHDKIRETVIKNLSSDRLKSLHQDLANVLETANADTETLAFHFRAAGETNKALKYLIAAAQQASQTLAFDHAAELYQLALDTPFLDEKIAQNLRLCLGDSLANAGRGAKASLIYLSCVDAVEPNKKLELQWRAAEQLLQSGHVDEGLGVFEEVLAKTGIKIPKSPLRILVSLITKRAWLSIRGLSFKLKDEKLIPKEDLLRLDICWSVSRGLGVVNPFCGAALQVHHLLLALKTGERERIARAFAGEALFYSLAGKHSLKRAEELISIAKSLSENLNRPYILGLINYCSGIIAFMSANWKMSYDFTKESERIFRDLCVGTTWNISNSQQFSMSALFYLGEFKQIFDLLPQLLKDADERGNLYAEIGLRVRLKPLSLLAEDQPEKAREEVKQALEKWSNTTFTAYHYFALVGETETILYRETGSDAYDYLMSQWQALSRSLIYLRMQYVFIESLHLRARCAIAAAFTSKTPQQFLVSAENDIKKIEKQNTKWGNALTLPLRAAICLLKDNVPQSIDLLERAEKDCDSINMTFYAIASRRSRGMLLGREQGESLISSADQWITSQKIKNPARMAAMFVPGKWDQIGSTNNNKQE